MASSKHLLKTPWRDHSKTPKEIDKIISLTASSSLATRRTIHFIEASRVDEKMSSLRLKYPAINIKKPDTSIPTTSKRTTDTEEPLQVSAIDKNIKKPEPKPLQVSTIDKKIKKPEPTDAKSKRKVDLEQRQAFKNDISTIEPAKGVEPKITVKSDAKVQTVVQGPGDPQKVLFSPELLSPDWVGNPRIGTGFGNVGNTCFLNASLQCLGHIPAFVQYVKNGNHAKQCNLSRRKKFCALCALNQVYTKSAHAKVYRPTPITANLQKIGGTMRTGDQEDAHEFVHSLFNSIQKSCLHGTDKKMDARSQETTFLHQVFGGYIENQIKCRSCGNESNRYEATLDLSLQVSDPGIQSVSQALANFTSPEILKGENKYQCGKCNQKVVASRRSTVYKSPMALQIQLKRFAFCGRRGGKFSKVAKHIDYPDVLDMTPFLSKGMKVRSLYSLTGVLVHSGSSPTYGHYYAYCKNANGKWYLMNDDKVTPVEPHVALKQQAYMLYYTRIGSPDSTPKVQRRNSLTAMVTKMKAALSPNLSAEEPRNVKRDSDGDIEMNKIPIDDEEKPKRRLSFCERVINVVKGAVRPASIDFKLNAPEVFTWNGDKSAMQQGGKRQRPNLCDLEMDRGKSKKIRLRKKLATNHNPFQFHK